MYASTDDIDDGDDDAILAGRDGSKSDKVPDPFAGLEGRGEAKRVGLEASERIERLKRSRDGQWEDVWRLNRRMRRTFREEKRVLVEKERVGGELRERMALHIDLMGESEEDVQRARSVGFGAVSEEGARAKVRQAEGRPLFEEADHRKRLDSDRKDDGGNTIMMLTKKDAAAAQQKSLLIANLRSNTRAAVDPFLATTPGRGSGGRNRVRIAGIKRKHDSGSPSSPLPAQSRQRHQPP